MRNNSKKTAEDDVGAAISFVASKQFLEPTTISGMVGCVFAVGVDQDVNV